MYILDVTPITKSLGKETLSYFSMKDIEIGSVVIVPLRKKEVPALVIQKHRLADIKGDLKRAEYQLRNIVSTQDHTLFSTEFMHACNILSQHYLANTGTVISSLIPKNLLSEYLEPAKEYCQPKYKPAKENLAPEKWLLQGNFQERIDYYKTYLRESFAQKKSVHIICPNQILVEQLHAHIKKGIDDRVFVFHSKLTFKKMKDLFYQAINHPQPIVIISTVSFLSLPRHDRGTIIVESEGSPQYTQQSRPFMDIVQVAEIFAKSFGLQYIAADNVPRFSTIYRSETEHWHTIKPFSFSLPKQPLQLVSFQEKDDDTKTSPKKVFSLFHDHTLDQIRHALEHHASIFVYIHKKGLAPLTVCSDCGETIHSPETGNPLVLYEKEINGEMTAFYVDQRTKKKYEAFDRCQNCGSWKLKMLGIGTDTVKRALAKQFPETEITVIDGTATTTIRQVQKKIESWKTGKKTILVGTEKVIPYLVGEEIDHVIITSLDSLLSLPGYTVREQIISRLFQLLTLGKQSLLQTRIPEHPFFSLFHEKSFTHLYKEDIQERKLFLYPPFSIHITLGCSIKTSALQKTQCLLQELFTSYQPTWSFQQDVRNANMVTLRMTCKVSLTDWEDEQNYEKRSKYYFKKIISSLSLHHTLLIKSF